MNVLYTISCPQCLVLESKLKKAEIPFEICDDIAIMKEKGYVVLPVLEVDGKALSFSEAIKWIRGEEV